MDQGNLHTIMDLTQYSQAYNEASIYNNLICPGIMNVNFYDQSDACIIDGWTELYFNNNTVIGTNTTSYQTNINGVNFDSRYVDVLSFKNNILYELYSNIEYDENIQLFEVDYCCYNGTIPNDILPTNNHNLTSDPDLVGVDYTLNYTNDQTCSPCINAGCPDLDGDGVDYKEDNDDRDVDHSRMDIGYIPYELPYDSRYLAGGWNWRSFPNLDLVAGEDYQDLVGPNGFLGYNYNPTIDDFEELRYKEGIIDYIVYYNWGTFSGQQNFNNKIFQYNGYKIERSNNSSDFILKIHNPEYDNSHEYSFSANRPYWVGYPLDETIQIDEYFDQSSTVDFSDIFKIESEDWVYYDDSSGRFIPPLDTRPWGSKPDGKFFEYGQTYIITFNNNIHGFRWDNGLVAGGSSKNLVKAQPTNFTFEEKPEYEVFEILSIEDSLNVAEVGIFEDGVCVGATVVESTPTQVLAYVSADSSSPGEITFQTSTGLRSDDPEISEFVIYNQLSESFESKMSMKNLNEINFVKIGNESSEELPLKIDTIQNYPNPFNPSTTISFYSNQEQHVDVSIFNIKGQKIKTLIDDVCSSGEKSIQWEGFDNNGKKVSSGIYFYKVESNNQKIMKKMILLK